MSKMKLNNNFNISTDNTEKDAISSEYNKEVLTRILYLLNGFSNQTFGNDFATNIQLSMCKNISLSIYSCNHNIYIGILDTSTNKLSLDVNNEELFFHQNTIAYLVDILHNNENLCNRTHKFYPTFNDPGTRELWEQYLKDNQVELPKRYDNIKTTNGSLSVNEFYNMSASKDIEEFSKWILNENPTKATQKKRISEIIENILNRTRKIARECIKNCEER